jgi:hypothetical protein
MQVPRDTAMLGSRSTFRRRPWRVNLARVAALMTGQIRDRGDGRIARAEPGGAGGVAPLLRPLRGFEQDRLNWGASSAPAGDGAVVRTPRRAWRG